MGTRHLIIIYYQGKYVVAQYGQWDGYPDGQGVRILHFFSHPDNLQKLKDSLHVVYEATQDDLKRFTEEITELERTEPQEPTLVDRVFRVRPLDRLYPSLSRDTSAKILNVIIEAAASGKRVPVTLQLEFINDGLFCEWAYVIDLDRNQLEVYSGVEPKDQARSRRFVGMWEQDDEPEEDKSELERDPSMTPRLLAEFSLRDPPNPTAFVQFFHEIDSNAEGE